MYVSLHNHTDYSPLSSLIRVKTLVNRALECGMPAVAITDTSSLAGALELRCACMRAGVKPIYGMETLVLVDNGKPDRVVLLAETNDGWRNLITLSSISCTTGTTAQGQCVTREQLEEFSTGLIALSGGHEGRIHEAFLAGRSDEARELGRWYTAVFGRDNFFIEVQPHMSESGRTQRTALAQELRVALVLTTDSRMLDTDGAEALDVLDCIRKKTTVSKLACRHLVEECLFLTPEDAQSRYSPEFESAIANTVAIALRCAADPAMPPCLPAAPLPDDFTNADTYLRHLCEQGLEQRAAGQELHARLESELKVIAQQDFAGYFLIVADFVAEANRLGMPHVTRGSASSSAVCWALGITELNPVAEGLFFERFINPTRSQAMPDIDIDFPASDRHQIVEYLSQRYGRDSVCNVAAYGHFARSTALRHAAHALEIGATTIAQLSDTNDGAADIAKRLSRCAELIEGLAFRVGTHACGVVVAPGPLVHHLPVRLLPSGESDAMLCAQWEGNYVQDSGCVKLDLLSLTALTVLAEGARLVRLNRGVDWTFDRLDFSDQATRQLLGSGHTTGVFQLESRGIQDYLRTLGEIDFEDVVALNAMYRPGPMELIDGYIRRRKGQEPIPSVHPIVDRILASTMGLLIYQEQVMAIACELGGLNQSESDVLRRALGMRREDRYAQVKPRFVDGAVRQGMTREAAERCFEYLLCQSAYCFAKAHALPYGRTTWRVAQLKANWPQEFFLASFNATIDEPNGIQVLTQEAVRMSVGVFQPDINASDLRCTIQSESIRIGLKAVKGLGQGAVSIVETRNAAGPYCSMFDLCARVRLSAGQLTGLIAAGATSSLPGTRAWHFASRRAALQWGRTPDRDTAAAPQLSQVVDCLDVLREVVSLNREAVADLSFDVYCPVTYSHHARLSIWMPPRYFLQRTDLHWLVSRLQPAIAALRPALRETEYAIGLNSRVDQYSEKHFLLLDLDQAPTELPSRLRELGGYFLSSGRGLHFIGRHIIEGRHAWEQLMASLLDDDSLAQSIDRQHVEMSLKRGYATLRVLESPLKPIRPTLVEVC